MPTPLRRLRLTDAFVRSSKCVAVGGVATDFFDTEEGGLSLRVSPKGLKTWTLRYRPAGAKIQRRVSLGHYLDRRDGGAVGDVAVTSSYLGVADARMAARRMRVAIDAKLDPGSDIQRSKRSAREAQTVAETAAAYFTASEKGLHRRNGKPKRPRTIADERVYFTKFIEPKLGQVRVTSLDAEDVEAFLEELPTRGAQRNARIVLNGLLSFAVFTRQIGSNPVVATSPVKYKSREAVIEDVALSKVLRAFERPQEVDDLDLSRGVAIATLLAANTLQRRGEVTGALRSEFDLKQATWIIPSSRTKNGVSHVVPLSVKAVHLVAEAMELAGGSIFLFPSPRTAGGEDRSITPAALSRAWRRVCRVLNLSGIRPHDLRRTGATAMVARLTPRVDRFIVSQVLNHLGDTGGAARVTSTYARYDYLDEKRDALSRWSVELDRILNLAEPVA